MTVPRTVCYTSQACFVSEDADVDVRTGRGVGGRLTWCRETGLPGRRTAINRQRSQNSRAKTPSTQLSCVGKTQGENQSSQQALIAV